MRAKRPWEGTVCGQLKEDEGRAQRRQIKGTVAFSGSSLAQTWLKVQMAGPGRALPGRADPLLSRAGAGEGAKGTQSGSGLQWRRQLWKEADSAQAAVQSRK